MLQLNKFSTKHDRIEQAFFIVVFVYESSFLEWGASPPNPPGFVALRATTHSARRSLWIALLAVTICSIQHLFNCSSNFVQMHLSSGYLINQIFVQISTCSIDFLFNWFLFNWLFVQLIFVQLTFCSIVLFNCTCSVWTWWIDLSPRPTRVRVMHGSTGGGGRSDEHDAGVDDGDGQCTEEESAEGGRRREQCR